MSILGVRRDHSPDKAPAHIRTASRLLSPNRRVKSSVRKSGKNTHTESHRVTQGALSGGNVARERLTGATILVIVRYTPKMNLGVARMPQMWYSRSWLILSIENCPTIRTHHYFRANSAPIPCLDPIPWRCIHANLRHFVPEAGRPEQISAGQGHNHVLLGTRISLWRISVRVPHMATVVGRLRHTQKNRYIMTYGVVLNANRRGALSLPHLSKVFFSR
ncbi:hypothetical protein BD324DRAFT_48491 [Kockovaella imperatae]|uniref:Uncharacterized protein n=1 Tax=Kockovaella imperatae TaxID=4999 RepID=A0A1Y1UVF4_9TREE|nr:hypothetical protein BD324DRAFT_48491 [Kockovaella imperatae]ORX41195.1 hypothetical protein BD324DRAFT_48491 [Kockovaella imperatae]